MVPRAADVVIVGGGSCGSVLAARLSEDPACSVLLIESGAGDPVPASPTPAHILPIGPGSPRVRLYSTTLRRGLAGTLVRGRGPGGSGAVNGAYFVRATPADLESWGSTIGGGPGRTGWSYGDALPYFRRSENDRDFGSSSAHGAAGPVPVSRRPAGEWSTTTARFVAAAEAMGFPGEPDKNAGGPPGIGPVPCNIDRGMRVDPGSAYLAAAAERPNLTVWTGATVAGLQSTAGAVRAVQVIRDGESLLVEAGTAVVAAGAIETPALLWRSGIGDPRILGAATVHPLPGVGREFSDHPEITVPYDPVPRRPAADPLVAERVPPPILEACLNLNSGDGAVEIRPYTASFGDAVPGNPRMPPVLGAALMAPRGRGRMVPHPTDPLGAPRIEHHYLSDPRDKAAAVAAVDLARGLLDASGIGAPIDGMTPHLGTSQHLSGTCPMGSDVGTSVVDQCCRVHGIAGLYIVDTSVFPRVPSRGPHATAVMLAERAAEFIASGFP
ncbi:mycofactocin system GMC family oxidoreductase MftG [Tomitella fengzijianii]|uniref:Mycofactocin system GMC family oxidoreductase MftG n=1 Tax=Tomitella fengzijianii TaxID=2597660 RepID=A0A516X1L4_9ACTN|nr:mycofactocin system GMC family oxidoreductase MftG [Tomitella fengzijianii]QDQ96917.1 mycofactocin system GMC family oxidoreductase MftG [Tomitella fengzijianii]